MSDEQPTSIENNGSLVARGLLGGTLMGLANLVPESAEEPCFAAGVYPTINECCHWLGFKPKSSS